MKRKITLEEHFAIEETQNPRAPEELKSRLLDFENDRLQQMDANGIEFSIQSLNAPAVQEVIQVDAAIDLAQRSNDLLAEQVARHPSRFGGLGALPMQDPDAAILELNRCVNELGFVGVNVNGFSQKGDVNTHIYYDIPEYRPFWAATEELDVPFYLHPRNPLTDQMPMYNGHPWLTYATWAFAMETSVHALRLMCSGIFDEHPNLQLILGHLGERIPFDLWRLDHRLEVDPQGLPAKKSIRYYMQNNVHVTTSGQFYDPPLHLTMKEVGVDRVLFSVDYPFESMENGSAWFDNADISDEDRLAMGRTNAVKLFNLTE
jgi:predicted TIM-barrel fold metal-dependent hydrolase